MGFRNRVECGQLFFVRHSICTAHDVVRFAIKQILRTIAKQIVCHCRRGMKGSHILVKFTPCARLVGAAHAVIHRLNQIVAHVSQIIWILLAEEAFFPGIESHPVTFDSLIYLCLTYTALHHAHSFSTMNPLQLSAYCRRSVSFSSRAATLRLSSTYCPSW